MIDANNATKNLGISIVYYEIVHKGENAGKILVYDEHKESVNFVGMAFDHSRQYWHKFNPSKDEQTLLCGSCDGKVPDSGTKMKAFPCKDCPDSAWTGEKKDVQPLCTEIYTMLCYDVDLLLPFKISMKRTSISSFRNYMYKITSLEAQYKEKLFITNLSLKRRDENCFVPVFKIEREYEVPRKEMETLANGLLSKPELHALPSVRATQQIASQETTPPKQITAGMKNAETAGLVFTKDDIFAVDAFIRDQNWLDDPMPFKLNFFSDGKEVGNDFLRWNQIPVYDIKIKTGEILNYRTYLDMLSKSAKVDSNTRYKALALIAMLKSKEANENTTAPF